MAWAKARTYKGQLTVGVKTKFCVIRLESMCFMGAIFETNSNHVTPRMKPTIFQITLLLIWHGPSSSKGVHQSKKANFKKLKVNKNPYNLFEAFQAVLSIGNLNGSLSSSLSFNAICNGLSSLATKHGRIDHCHNLVLMSTWGCPQG